MHYYIVEFSYLFASVFFIVGLKSLSHPDTARRGMHLAEIGMLLAPAAVGLALSAACAVAAFEQDVQGASFGWRQPLGVITGASMLIGLVPALAATADGHWFTPSTLPKPKRDEPRTPCIPSSS